VFIDRILRGMKAGEIPIEQPTKLELMVNVKTAKALNLVLPKSLMIRAREKPTSAVCSADNEEPNLSIGQGHTAGDTRHPGVPFADASGAPRATLPGPPLV